MARLVRVVILLTCLIGAKSALAQGTCPSGLPVGTPSHGCYYVAANGSDSNNGTSESTPWLHAPGMPNCANNCASLASGSGGIGFIFRGGDTWHEGNSSAGDGSRNVSTGGTWDIYHWFGYAYGNYISTCAYEGTQTGCVYFGVDQTWYSGSAWARPILTGDNPTLSGSGNYVTSCAYQIPNPPGDFGVNNLVVMPGWTVLDNFELTGLCASTLSSSNVYLAGWASGASGTSTYPTSYILNSYLHGWTSKNLSGSQHPVGLIAGGAGIYQVTDHDVIDGSDSNPEVAALMGGWYTHTKNNIFRYVGQGSGNACHDVHDNIWEHWYYTINDGHINIFECTSDATTNTANVFYNNTFQENDPSVGNAEGAWFCPNTTPEYWFNNIMYDMFPPNLGQPWNVAGEPTYAGCSWTGGQFMFNNTLVDAGQPCYLGGNGTNYISVYNEQLIGTPYANLGGPQCTGGPSDASNISMTNAQATSAGYTTGSSGFVGNGNTCVGAGVTPCAPPSSSSATVAAGKNLMGYCSQLATYTSEPAISVDAANACKYGTTNGCLYNSTIHTMNCPANTPVARPTSGAWDAGAYQYSGAGVRLSAPNPPLGLKAVVN